jgi:HEPN domain-containing protein
MPHDPARAADARAWIEKATLDLRSAEADLAARPAIIGDALFHCQQAVEKALKGLLAWHDEPFRKTHDLAELGARVAGLEAGLEPLLRQAAPLTQYAWRYRYPGETSEPLRAEADAALGLAREVVAAAEQRLPAPGRPPG